MKKLSIVVPVYNEEKTIRYVLKTLLDLPMPEDIEKEIIVVNDNSTDRTNQVLEFFKKKGIAVLRNKENLGKTGTVQRGVLASTGDVVVVQDADNEYEPYDLLKMVILMAHDPRIDAVYGNRFHKRNKNKGMNHLGNRFLTMVSNFFTIASGIYVKDMEVCYKMIRGDLFREIAETFQSDRFGLEPETTAKLAKRRANVRNIDIHYYPRSIQEGKKLDALKDGARALKQIVMFNFFLPFFIDRLPLSFSRRIEE
jgi:glycosyltransferase involved in cell wall biosynthesis